LFATGENLPVGVDFTNRFIYYVGPVDPVRDEVMGPAGPTTATRMDKFTEMMLARTGLLGMIGGPSAARLHSRRSGNTNPSTLWRWAAQPIWFQDQLVRWSPGLRREAIYD
jgi:hypothetical protein